MWCRIFLRDTPTSPPSHDTKPSPRATAEVLQFSVTSEAQEAAAPVLRLQCSQREVTVSDQAACRKRRRFSMTSASSAGEGSSQPPGTSVTPLLAALLAVPCAESDAATATRTAAVRAALAAAPLGSVAAYAKTDAQCDSAPSSSASGEKPRSAPGMPLLRCDGAPLYGTPLHAAVLAAASYPRSCVPALELLASTMGSESINAGLTAPAHAASPLEGATALQLLMLLGAHCAPYLHHAVRKLVQAGADRRACSSRLACVLQSVLNAANAHVHMGMLVL